jgi:peptidoglycan hydrolase-like protein with peptidoglycan-binding domain
MNESAPVSIRGYLREYGLMLEDLSREEAQRLQAIYNDLEMLTQTPEVPNEVKNSISSEIDNAPEVARGVTTPVDPPKEIEGEPLEPTGDEEDNSGEEKNTDSDNDEEEPAQEPDREPSGSLAKFAQSGEKGLANNPEEKETIEELQQFLTDVGYDTRGVDGIYGGGTTESVKGFQKAFGLTADGDAGPNTIQVIQDYKNDMEQLDYLLGKLDTDNQSNESNDLRHLIAIVEGKLFEALNDDEKARAQAIIDKYSEIVDNLPSQAQQELGSKLEQLEAGTEQSTDDNADNAQPAADAAYKTVDGSGRNRSYTTYDKDGNEIDSGMGFGPRNLPSKEEFEQPADNGDDSVKPRPTGNSRRNRREQQAWDRQYSDTHNPDGSPKSEEPEQGQEEPQQQQEPQSQTQQEPEQQSLWSARIKSAGEPTNASEAAAFVTNIPENERSQYRAQLSPQEQEIFDRMASGET